MRKTILFILLNLFLVFTLKAQVVLNEIQAENATTIYNDVDSSNSDWIELYNKGNSTVNLQGYGLSDGNNYFKWVFPSVDLPAQQHLLVFASGDNVLTYMNHWETAVSANDTWKDSIPGSTITDWYKPSYTDNSWSSKNGPFGFGYSAVSTTVPHCKTLYLRKTFNIDATNLSKVMKVGLIIDWNDGFVAYLNGNEIARSNVSGYPPAYNASAIAASVPAYTLGFLPNNYIIDLSTQNFLQAGDNVLAIEVHNVSSTDTTLFINPYLFIGVHDFTQVIPGSTLPSWFFLQNNYLHTNFKLNNNENISLTAPGTAGPTIDNTINIGNLYTDASMARIPDGNTTGGVYNGWCYTEIPTPNYANPTTGCGTGFTNQPQANIKAGFYNNTQHVSLSCSSPNTAIYYTLNGNNPKTTDKLYTAPITVDTTLVIRARAFSTNGTLLPGQPFTATYIINDSTLLYPVVSLSTDSLSLWDWNTGIYVKGPHASPNRPFWGANFWQSWAKEGHVEFLTRTDSLKFSMDAFLAMNGNYSRDRDQKSFSITTKSSLDTSSINYQIFPDRTTTDYKRFVLRNAGSDNLFGHLRDECLQTMFEKSYNDWEANRPCHVFLNGKYWGVYHLHEKSDKYYLQENYGANPDSVDLIKNSAAQDGNLTAFYNMSSWFRNNPNLALPNDSATAFQYWDVNNLIDYYIAEIFIENQDWISRAWTGTAFAYWVNNIKLWREQKPGAKWRYNLHDIDQGALPYANLNYISHNSSVNFLSQTITQATDTASPIYSNLYSLILYKFLQNHHVKNNFIDRYADLLNTILLPSKTVAVADTFHNRLLPVMQMEINRWGITDPASHSHNMTEWEGNITDFKTFLKQRPDTARKEIISYFGLSSTLDTITCDVADKTQGTVQISTILLDPSILPWKGIYFHGTDAEVPFKAVPNPGYVFDYWEANNNVFGSNNYTSYHFINFPASDILRAHFKVAPNLTFSELNYKSDPTRDTKDWIELHNFGTTAMNIAGWKIHKPATGETYTIPSGSIIPANGYMVFSEDIDYMSSKYSYNINNLVGPMNFGFNDTGDEIQLLNAQDGIILDFIFSSDSTIWPGCAAGYGRTLELKSNTFDINNPANWACGCMLGSPGAAHSLCPETVLFNEINFNSSPTYPMGDWIELYNRSNTTADVSNWVFKDGNDLHSFVIPTGTTIPAYGYLVLTRTDTSFHTVWPWTSNLVGNFNFGLSSSGDVIRLYSSDGKIYQSMYYKPRWGRTPPYADGTGYTLEFDNNAANINPNDSANWFIGCIGGSPGFAYNPSCPAVGIKTFTTNENYNVYPNPANTIVNIEWNTIYTKEMYFQLYDLQGRLLNEVPMQGKTKISLGRNGLQSGIYIYRIRTNNSVTGAGKLIFD